VLVGCAFGIAMLLISALRGFPGYTTQFGSASGVGRFLTEMIGRFGLIAFESIAFLCLLSLLRSLLRNDKLAALTAAMLVLVPVASNINTAGSSLLNPRLFLIGSIALLALDVFVLMRFGLIALVVAWMVEEFFLAFPTTLQSSFWYSGASYAV